MGEVRVAHDSWIGRDVAVKVLRGDHTPDDVFARFRREAQVQARLEHPSIVPVHDMGVDPHGRPFFVMKRLTGATLFEIISARPEHWSRRTLLVRLVDVCQAIAFAHQRGVVHRDLKPSNIMLGDFGEVYVLDWGIARVLTRASDTIQHDDLGSIDDVAETQIGSVIGTPGYMAPEQMRGEPVERSFDIYALGCILFEILTGTTALPSGSEALEATLNALPHRPRLRVPTADVPPELDELCADATAPAINDRLSSVDNFARRLQRYLDGDRDEAQRQALALMHLENGRNLLAGATLQGRADAMLEAGRALALAPTNRDAQSLIAQLLLERPSEIPPEVDARVEVARVAMGRVLMRTAVKTNLAYFLAAPLLLLTRIASPAVLVVLAVLLLADAAVLGLGARRQQPVGRLVYLALTLHCSLLAVTGVVFSPFLVLPALAAISVTAFVAHPTRSLPFAVVVGHALAVGVPLIAELIGVLPRTFSLSGDTLSITPWAVVVPAVHMVWIVSLLTLVQLGTAAVLVLDLRRAEASAQRDVYLNRWHLEQLVR